MAQLEHTFDLRFSRTQWPLKPLVEGSSPSGVTRRQPLFLDKREGFLITVYENSNVDKSGQKCTHKPLLCEQNYVNGLCIIGFRTESIVYYNSSASV